MSAASNARALLVVPTLSVALTAYTWRSLEARQHSWQADVSVRAIDVTPMRDGGSLTTRVAVTADSDRARAVRVEVMLPIGVAVMHVAEGCQTSPSPIASLSARVTCSLGDLPVRGLRYVFVTTTGKPVSQRARFAAFAFSDTPDPHPTNNYAERVVP
jgi:hypothetical protein